jgi:pimeloyl-ACP methyl ester carboxylesterase
VAQLFSLGIVMSSFGFVKRAFRVLSIPFGVYLLLVIGTYCYQRSLLFFPTHLPPVSRLTAWQVGGSIIGYCREVTNARAIWLMAHGNGGQAADRDYVLGRMSDQDSLYVLEYPGYGAREGHPSKKSMDGAASQAYELLRAQHPGKKVCVLGESLGSGPACSLAHEKVPPDKIVLVVPFDTLASVASERFWFLPVRLLLRDRWNNVEMLQDYAGPVEIFGAVDDTIIPIHHARFLAKKITRSHFTAIPGGHNDWADCADLQIAP